MSCLPVCTLYTVQGWVHGRHMKHMDHSIQKYFINKLNYFFFVKDFDLKNYFFFFQKQGLARNQELFKSQWQFTQWTAYISSNFNSCSERLCEGIGQTSRKDDSTLAICVQLFIYGLQYAKVTFVTEYIRRNKKSLLLKSRVTFRNSIIMQQTIDIRAVLFCTY